MLKFLIIVFSSAVPMSFPQHSFASTEVEFYTVHTICGRYLYSLPYMQTVQMEIKGFEWRCDCERIVQVDEYDDGAFKLFMTEATASYHLRFIFHLDMHIFVCFPSIYISFKICNYSVCFFPPTVSRIIVAVSIIVNLNKEVEHETYNLPAQSNTETLIIATYEAPYRHIITVWYAADQQLFLAVEELNTQRVLDKIKGQTDIWKDRQRLAIIYFIKPHTPAGCQPCKCDVAIQIPIHN